MIGKEPNFFSRSISHKFSTMKIGITGASGMLGNVLVSIISKSHHVLATSRSKGVEEKNVEWDCFDLTNFELLNK